MKQFNIYEKITNNNELYNNEMKLIIINENDLVK